jgi:glyoxylate reductase
MPANLLVTGKTFCPEFLQLLKEKGYRVTYRSDPLDESALMELIVNQDAFILGGIEFASARVIHAARRLKVIAVTAVGYQSYVDVDAATQNGIAVTNTPHANSRATAEMTLGLILALRRQIAFVNELAKAGEWRDDIVTNELFGETIGIVGMGAIGSLVAEIASKGFGMSVVYYSRHPKPDVEQRTGARYVSLGELLKSSDIVSLHVPITDETREMLKESQFRQMKGNAILINTARPQVIAPKALAQALRDGLIAGCAMDGYYTEPAPLPEADPYGLLALPNNLFLLSPHIAYLTEESINEMCRLATQSVIHLIDDQPWDYVVNPDYKKYSHRT